MSELDELKSSWEKLSFFNDQKFEKGLKLAREATSNWNGQSNPGKVFIKGRRVHHGTGGAALVLLGIAAQNSEILGYAYGLMEDDIADIDEWFDFEKGGDPNSFLSVE